jgi:hypothetical protein
LLTFYSSHLILQLNNFRACAQRLRQGIVRILGLRCRSGRLHHSYSVLDRYQGSPNSDSYHIPHHGYLLAGCRSGNSDARDSKRRCTSWTSRPVSQITFPELIFDSLITLVASSTSSPSHTRSEKDPLPSSTPPKSSLRFSVSRAWHGLFASTTPLVWNPEITPLF